MSPPPCGLDGKLERSGSVKQNDITHFDYPAGEWLTVCLGCGRLKRGAMWTEEEVELPVKGISTGFCDPCFLKRKSMGRRQD